MQYTAIRELVITELKKLDAEIRKLTVVLRSLDNDSPTLKQPKTQKRDLPLPKTNSRRIRLNEDTRNSLTAKILKAAKAHGKAGASKADIIKYLKTSGYEVGHHFNLPHMFGILTSLRGEGGKITTTGEKAKMRYHAV